jgi:hypothetical protein
MGAVLGQDESVRNSAQSVYRYVGSQIASLIPRFGLQPSRSQIVQVYDEICRESLAFPLGAWPPGYSRINQDGMPFQYSVTLGKPHHALQFLSEAGQPGLAGAERMEASRACITAVARRLQAEAALSSVADLLDNLAPGAHPDLLADPAGAFWIGVAFAAGHLPRMKIYTNARWGAEPAQWARLDRFASFFGALAPWQSLGSRLKPDFKPLGAAVTLGRGKRPSGRIYLSAYGKPIATYAELARTLGGESFQNVLRDYARCLMGDDYPYPTQTAVCSFGFGAGQGLAFKFELCAHCLFASDLEAASRLQTWFAAAGLDPAGYTALLEILSEGRLSETAPDLHCYTGVGLDQGEPYFTIYLKPKFGTAHAH